MQWTESVGLTLVGRDQSSMQLRTPTGQILNFTILQIFPFTYESKRMGIIVRVSARSSVFCWDYCSKLRLAFNMASYIPVPKQLCKSFKFVFKVYEMIFQDKGEKCESPDNLSVF